MSDEKTMESKQEVEETTVPAAPQEEQKPEEAKLEEDESKQPEVESVEVDYKAMLEAERARSEKAEAKIVKLKREKKDRTIDDEEEEIEVSSEDRVAKLVDEKLRGLEEKIRGEVIVSEVDDLLGEITTNEDEKELIKHIYDNRLQKSGFSRASIREDLVNAKVLANRDKIIRENVELSQALKARKTLNTSASFSSSTREGVEKEMSVNEKERKLLEKFGAVERFKKQNN